MAIRVTITTEYEPNPEYYPGENMNEIDCATMDMQMLRSGEMTADEFLGGKEVTYEADEA